MKRITTFLTLLIISLPFSLSAQEAGDEIFKVKMQYGSSKITNLSQLKSLKFEVIKKVELVYTTFATSPDFNQKKLNEERLKNLKSQRADFFSNELTTYSEVPINGCHSMEEGRRAFHGFRITYRPVPSPERTEREITKLLKILEEEPETADLNSEKEEVVEKSTAPGKAVSEVAVLEAVALDSVMSKKDWRKYKKGKETDEVTWTYLAPVHSGPSVTTLSDGKPVTEDQKKWLGESVVGKVMERNPEWKDMMVVVDVTGSMYAYLGQTMLWLKLNQKLDRTKSHVFFNDGDNKPQSLKIVGKTGGIYTSKSKNFKEVLNTSIKAMRSGGGGDGPENNLEAVIKGLNECTDCGDIIMIADNWATPRDLKLYKKIDRPIKIIVCGTFGGINPEYLNLARNLDGSVHTIEKDLDDLAKLVEGQTIEVSGIKYKVKDGKFVRAS